MGDVAPAGDRLVVLLVDDQRIIGETIRRMLASEPDIAFHYCASGTEALRVVADLRPTVILQDLVLADGDGLDLVAAYRALPATATVPILVLSTTEDPAVKSRAFARGANDYLVKVPDRVELVARIRYHSGAHLAALQRDEAFRTLIALNQQLNRFVGMAAHDLRSPLGVLQGFAEYMLYDPDQPPTPQQAEFLTMMQDSAAFMLRLVDDLLDVSAIEEGRLTLDMRPTDLGALLAREVALARLLAAKKEIAIELDPGSDGALVPCDAQRIRQVISNLLSNAIKYSHPKTTVRVTLTHADGQATIAVRDQGQGIPATEVQHLFQAFGTTSVRSTGGEKSTGLGLMIARQVVVAHGGRIWVESAVGEGSTFSVALPIAPPGAPA